MLVIEIALLIYLIIGMLMCISALEGDLEFYEAILWPLLFIKYILKGLWIVLFTNWKP